MAAVYEVVILLCEACEMLESTSVDRAWWPTKLRKWWEEHKTNWHNEKELEKQRRIDREKRIRELALTKLNDEEKRVLGIR